MSEFASFDSTKKDLDEILKKVHDHNIQLPEFQRDWIWDDERIKSLLASVIQFFPIGAIMLLETGSDSYRFKERPIQSAGDSSNQNAESLILDGQQRLTSLYSALMSGKVVNTVDTKKKKIKRWYYIKIDEAINPRSDLEEAIFSISEEKVVKNFRGEIIEDYSSPELEFQNEVFPLTKVYDFATWRTNYQEYWDYDREKSQKINQFETEIINNRIKKYELPIIRLGKNTPKEAVCLVFEKVNTGGMTLTVFELLTATFAAEEFDLRQDWDKIEKELHQEKVLRRISNTDFLQTTTLLASFMEREKFLKNGEIEDAPPTRCKRKDILKLDLEDYNQWRHLVKEGYQKVVKFLFEQNIYNYRDVPYQTQLNPLAAILAALGDDAERDDVRSKITRWFWCGVLGELYGSAVETRISKDLPEVVDWVSGSTNREPTSIQDANFNPSRLLTLRTRNSAAYKGLYALLMKEGGKDFRSGKEITVQSYFDESIDIHHIFPRKWCRQKGLEKEHYDSIVNKTPLSAKTNRMIGGKAPSDYLQKIQNEQNMSKERMDDILCSHVITPELLRENRFDKFFEERAAELLSRIERATGKEVDIEDLDKLSLDGEYLEEEELEEV